MSATAEILPPKSTVAVDAMGGDDAPLMVIEGLAEAARLHPTVTFLVFGDRAQLEPLIAKHPKIAAQLIVRHAPDAIPAGERPRNALKAKFAETSLSLAMQSVAGGEASALISAGDTGVLMALGMKHFGLFEGIDRPGVASFMPTLKNETVMLDLGANLIVGAKILHQFAVLGTALSEAMMAITNPRIGLLNIGSEDSKGLPQVQEAHDLLSQTHWPGSYEGFVEPLDLIEGKVDVLVCDGYAGNIMLKSVEATTNLVGAYTRATFTESFLARIGYFFAARQFAKLRRRIDPRRYNGAVMAGLTQVCVKSHGGADGVSFANAVEMAIDMVNRDYTRRVPELLASQA